MKIVQMSGIYSIFDGTPPLLHFQWDSALFRIQNGSGKVGPCPEWTTGFIYVSRDYNLVGVTIILDLENQPQRYVDIFKIFVVVLLELIAGQWSELRAASYSCFRLAGRCLSGRNVKASPEKLKLLRDFEAGIWRTGNFADPVVGLNDQFLSILYHVYFDQLT